MVRYARLSCGDDGDDESLRYLFGLEQRGTAFDDMDDIDVDSRSRRDPGIERRCPLQTVVQTVARSCSVLIIGVLVGSGTGCIIPYGTTGCAVSCSTPAANLSAFFDAGGAARHKWPRFRPQPGTAASMAQSAGGCSL